LENVKAILLSNTDIENLTVANFYDSQEALHNPMVIFCNMETKETYGHFHIVAKDMEELVLMYETKVFYTSCVPEGEYERHYGAVFYGVKPKKNIKRKKKERTAATVRSS
jgi:hypothetical protein